MDPFARKMIFGSVAFGSAMLLFAAAMSVVYFHNRPRCSEQILTEVTSPGGQWTAAVMERRCGEDSPFFIHVNLRLATEPLRFGYFSGRASGGEVFVVEEDTQGMAPALAWSSGDQLTVQCPRCRPGLVERREERLGAISIQYQLQP